MSTKTLEAANRITGNGHAKDSAPKAEQLVISPLRQTTIIIPIVGETPLKILRFSKKSRDTIQATQMAGDQAKTKRKREAKDFHQNYLDAQYRCTKKEGNKTVTWLGLNASGVRNGAIETCRVAGFKMTVAKMSVRCVADGFDDIDKTPLVRIYGEPQMSIDPVRNASGVVDLRARCMWPEWRCNLTICFDEAQFSPADIVNLFIRVGQQNGLGEGRMNGTNGNGCDGGVFLVDVENVKIQPRKEVPRVFQG